MKQVKIFSLFLFLLLIFNGCSSISTFNETAYKQAIDLKVESLALMDYAIYNYLDYSEDVELLKIDLEKAYQFAKHRPDNEITTKQWEILIDPERNLLGGFLKKWEDDNALTETFVDEMKGEISDAFDKIIELESGKIKPDNLE